MTGSSFISFVVPIMAFVAMDAWLGLVFHADRHPGYRRAESTAGTGGESDAPDAEQDPAAAPVLDGLADSGAVGPLDHEGHERIDDRTLRAALR